MGAGEGERFRLDFSLLLPLLSGSGLGVTCSKQDTSDTTTKPPECVDITCGTSWGFTDGGVLEA